MNRHTHIYIMLLTTMIFTGPLIANSIDTKITNLLQKYTTETGVKYAELRGAPELNSIIQTLATMPLPKSQKAQKAYWLNVYNLYTIKLIVDNYPLDSIVDLNLFGSLILGHIFNRSVWITHKFEIRGKTHSLDIIEHQIIRPQFKDYRVHAAMVCAAVSCPPLRREAYTAEKIDLQLDDQMLKWMADKTKNDYDQKTNTLYISFIFDWFNTDFTENKHKLFNVIRIWLPKSLKKTLENRKKQPTIKYLEYNWKLNDVSKKNSN